MVGGCGEEIGWWMAEGPAVQSAQSEAQRDARAVLTRTMTLSRHALVTLTSPGIPPL